MQKKKTVIAITVRECTSMVYVSVGAKSIIFRFYVMWCENDVATEFCMTKDHLTAL